jgi:hypothetical protein
MKSNTKVSREMLKMQRIAGLLTEGEYQDQASKQMKEQPDEGDYESEYTEIENEVKQLYKADTGQELTPNQESDIYEILDAINGFSFRMDNEVKLSDGRTTKINHYMKEKFDNGNYRQIAQDIYEILVNA